MRVLVIGGAGYIGSHASRAMADRGYEVTVFDNMSSGREENIFRDTEFIKGDIRNFNEILASVKNTDAVVHLAAFKAVGESMENPEKYSVNNICGTLNILNACAEAGVKNIVFSSSAAVYGEPKYIPIDEEHPVNPENYYGFTKLEIERFLSWYDRLKGIRYASLRYFNAAGYDPEGRVRGLEKDPANLLPVIMETAIGMRDRLYIFGDDWDTADGTGVRDYIHVKDLADAHIKALEYISKNDRSVTVNLGSEEGLSVKEILERAREITGKEIPAEIAPRRPGDIARLVASSRLARQTLGWKPLYSDVKSLIGTTWEVYRELRR